MLAATLLAATLLGAPACSRAGAEAAIRATRLTIPASQSISGQAIRVDPGQADAVICLMLAGGKRAMAVSLASGGTAGDIDWVVFVADRRTYAVSLVRGGYKLGLTRLRTDLVETDAIYKTADPNCCPTGGFIHTRWRWNGREFAVVGTWHDSSFAS